MQRYDDAFVAFIECAGSPSAEQQCATQWLDGVQPLLCVTMSEAQPAAAAAAYYVGLLRAHGSRSEYCEAFPATT